jgi:threonyl-tRNA synthetase
MMTGSPPIDDGFYYEMALPSMAAVEQADYKPLETIVSKIVKEKQPFERLELSKEDLLDMFKTNPYKCHIMYLPQNTSACFRAVLISSIQQG